MTLSTCPHCGANSSGAVCDYCGSLRRPLPDPIKERAALDEFHALVAGQPEEARVSLLASGFLPDQTPVLVEAGLRCVALLNDSTSFRVAGAVAQRVDAIAAKLDLMEPSGEIALAVRIFRERLARQRSQRRRRVLLGLAAMLLPLLAVFSLIWTLARFLGR